MATVSLGWIFLLASAIVCVEGYSFQSSYPADTSYLYTDTTFAYTNFFDVHTKEFFSFKLRACSDGHVILAKAQDEGSLGIESLEVVVSGWHNTQSVIREGFNGKHLVEADTTGMLHCAEYRQFWLSWARGMVRFGRGPSEGTETLLSYQYSSREFLVIGISTGYDYAGTWQVEENNALYLTVASPPHERYELIWKTVTYKNNFYNFMAGACSDINVALGTKLGSVDYNFVIGGWQNTRSVIRKYGVEMDVHDEAGVCHCGPYERAYWVSWDRGRLEMGQGHLKGWYKLLDWQDPDPLAVTHIGFTTAAGEAGIWSFVEDLENFFVFLREPVPDQNDLQFYNWVLAPHYQTVSFLTSACHDVYLMLTMEPRNTGVDPVDGLADDQQFIIYIGADGNRNTGIRRSFNEDPLLEREIEGLLQCEYPVAFWVNWWNNKISLGLGTGSSGGIPPLLEYDIPSQYQFPIQAFGFGSYRNVDVRYMVSKMYGDQVHLITPKEESRHHTWVTTNGDYYVTFDIQTCTRSYVQLCKWLGETSSENYDIDFAHENNPNQITMFRRWNGTEYRVEYTRANLLRCDEMETFWVSWVDQAVKLGRGTRYNKETILQMAVGEMYQIGALALHTPESTGQFKFDTDAGDYVLIPTQPSSINWFMLREYVSWLYLRVSGAEDATLMLSDRYMSDSHRHQISLSGSLEARQIQPLGNGDHLVENILNSGMSTDIWVSWTDGQFKLGKGRLRDVDTRLTVTDKGFTVKALGFTTFNENNEWQILHRHGDQAYYETTPSDNHHVIDNMWIAVSHRDRIVFDVQACSNAWIILSAALHSTNFSHSYHIEMMNSTTDGKTRLLLSSSHDRLVVNSPDYLACNEERYFWITWIGGHIALGRGRTYGSNRFLSWHDPGPFTVRGITVRTSNGQKGTWRFPFEHDLGDRQSSSGLSGGAVAGIVIGVLLAVVIVGGVAYVVLRGVPEPIRNVIPTSFGGGGAGSNSAGSTSRGSTGLPDRQMSFENPVQFEGTMNY